MIYSHSSFLSCFSFCCSSSCSSQTCLTLLSIGATTLFLLQSCLSKYQPAPLPYQPFLSFFSLLHFRPVSPPLARPGRQMVTFPSLSVPPRSWHNDTLGMIIFSLSGDDKILFFVILGQKGSRQPVVGLRMETQRVSGAGFCADEE